MKVFLPMPDEGLVSPELTTGTLVPFDPIFLEARGDLEERPRRGVGPSMAQKSLTFFLRSDLIIGG